MRAGNHFRGSPEALPSLRDSGGVDVVSQANNHTRDWESYGNHARLPRLPAIRGHPFCGARPTARRSAPPTLPRKIAVAFLAFDIGWAAGRRAGYPGVAVDAKDTRGIVRDISTARESADLVVVSFHWGTQMKNTPDAIQRFYAHLAAVDSGADLVLEPPSHVIQG